MTQVTSSEADHYLAQMRNELNEVYSCLDSVLQPLDEIQQLSDRIHALHEKLDSAIPKIRGEIELLLKPIEDTSIVLQRELSNLEALSHSASTVEPHLGMSIRTLSTILQLSVRLSAQVFSPQQLRMLQLESDPHTRDILRLRWQEWLKELSAYLEIALPLAVAVADLSQAESIPVQKNQNSLHKISEQAAQFSSLASSSLTLSSQTGEKNPQSATTETVEPSLETEKPEHEEAKLPASAFHRSTGEPQTLQTYENLDTEVNHGDES